MLVVLAAVAVFALGGYVITHADSVPRAGEILGSPTLATVSTTSSPAPHPKESPPPVVVFLGDDYTSGSGATATSARFTTVLCAALGATEVNLGAAGTGYAKTASAGDYLTRVARVVAAKPDVVVVSGGRNDVTDDPDTLATDARQLFAELHDKLPAAMIIAVAPFWGDSDPGSDLETVRTSVRQAAKAAGATFLDIPDPLHGHPEWMADQANPNDAGYAAIAAALEKKLRPLVRSAGPASTTLPSASVSPSASS